MVDYSYSKLLIGALCVLVLCQSSCADGAVQNALLSSIELRRDIQSSFHLLGYCSSPNSPECRSLASLLDSSEALTRNSLIKARLLEFDATSWQKDLNTSTITHLWFACYDGQYFKIKEVDSADLAAAGTADEQSSPAIAEAAKVSAAALCSFGVPFYACPQLPTVFKLDLLMSSLAAVTQQLGAACIAGQLRSMHPAAAAVAAVDTKVVLPNAAGVASTELLASEANPDNMTYAFLQDLDLHHQRYEHRGSLWFSLSLFVAVGALAALFTMMSFDIPEPNDCKEFQTVMFGLFAVLSAAVAFAGGVRVLLLCCGMESGWSCLCAAVAFFVFIVAVCFLQDIVRYVDSMTTKASATAPKGSSPSTACCAGLSSVGCKQSSGQQVPASAQCLATHQGANCAAQQAGTRPKPSQVNAPQAKLAPAGTSSGFAQPTGTSSNNTHVTPMLSTSVGVTATQAAVAAGTMTGSDGLVTPAAAAGDVASGVTMSSETERLRLDNMQLAELVTQLLKESADIRAAAAAATAAAAANLSAATREALACLQAQIDSMNSRLEDAGILARPSTAAGAGTGELHGDKGKHEQQ